MDKRVLTVGSLIPNRIVANQLVTLALSQTEDTPKIRQRNKLEESPSIAVIQNSRTFEISPLEGNLLKIALDQGQDLSYKCRKGTCGVCKVKVVKGEKKLSAPNEKEKRKLTNALEGGYRLACQAEVIG